MIFQSLTQLMFTCSKKHYRNTRKMCEISSKLAIKIPEGRHWCRSGIFISIFEHVSHFFSSTFVADFQQVNVSGVLFGIWSISHAWSKTEPCRFKLLRDVFVAK